MGYKFNPFTGNLDLNDGAGGVGPGPHAHRASAIATSAARSSLTLHLRGTASACPGPPEPGERTGGARSADVPTGRDAQARHPQGMGASGWGRERIAEAKRRVG